MQLSKIKIAGFKSFVDPTTLVLPSKLIAIVGPNGCGKSNIIDAVTWVMGESSPKYLRGEALTDVIFNGSHARKPVGQASVELVFDNADGAIGGEYAKFSEISVKRVINRDSESVYYLNGVRCRKRDISNLFLGTGLGPRSYSIIGQNMITRVIEAKPDELRVHLEEAAGISKYKERRHETELRINHTKENLARVQDVNHELETQLNHLKHQANVAEKFKLLKEQERILRAQLIGVEWRQIDSRMVNLTLQAKREETALEARFSELNHTDHEIEQLRHEQRVAQDAFQEIQRRYYAVGNEITRVEQDILHQQERQHQWESDLKQTESDGQIIKEQMEEAEDNLRDLEHAILNVEPELAEAVEESDNLQNQLSSAEEEMQAWQNRWDEFNQTTAKTNQSIQVEKTNMQHLEQRVNLLVTHQQQIQQEQARFNFSELTKEIEAYSKSSYEMADKLEYQNEQLAGIRKEIATLQTTQQDSTNHLDNIRSELQQLRGQQASLQALQQTALGQRDNPASPWVKQHGLEDKPRLAQLIEVEKKWEFAVEKILDLSLQAICVDKITDVAALLANFKAGNIAFFAETSRIANINKKKGNLLLEKIKTDCSLESLLTGIYVAEDLPAALALMEKLASTESVVTPDGIWLGKEWVKVLREENPAAGVFEREQQLKQLAANIDHLEAIQKELEKNMTSRREQLEKLEKKQEQVQQSCAQYQTQSAQLNAQHKTKQERLQELKEEADRLVRELEENNKELAETQAKLLQAKSLFEKESKSLEKQNRLREELIAERDKTRKQLQTIRMEATQKKQQMHEFEIRLQTALSQKAAAHQTISRLQTQLTSLNERKITLQSEISSIPPLETLKKSLSRTLDKHVSVESELTTARAAVETLEQEFRNLEEKRQIIERDINKVRTKLETLRVELQGFKVKSETLREQMKETEFTLEEILKDLPEDLTTEESQVKLDHVLQRINRLGPINLVAIDEYATSLERKEYLDKQLADLTAGLTTLEDAIAKIDKETKARFKQTFDKVNQHFQTLFPTVFGGGKAYLELTSDDLLTTGVTVMASPPGKRNSSIYLLSGGEKSLTAIALIFAIFNLNPAPFCLLDEVDAALDDANVHRFTNLLKTIADDVQFIFISHNKITIEISEQLIGVTMNEPGVSRLVSVDIEKAMTLAGA